MPNGCCNKWCAQCSSYFHMSLAWKIIVFQLYKHGLHTNISGQKQWIFTQFLQSEFLEIVHIGVIKGCACVVADQHRCRMTINSTTIRISIYWICSSVRYVCGDEHCAETQSAVARKFFGPLPLSLPFCVSIYAQCRTMFLETWTQNFQFRMRAHTQLE